MPDFGAMTREDKPKKRARESANGQITPLAEALKASRTVTRYLESLETGEVDPGAPLPDDPGVVPDKRLAFLNEHFNGHGAAILKAAQETHLPVYEGLGMLSKESPGGLNIFERGTPPAQWDGKPVTRELVQAMINRPGYRQGTASMWGVGMPQLTWWEFVLRAEALGGAHVPLNQLLVGFGILADNLGDLTRRQAFAAYNAGRSGMQRGLGFEYADDAMRLADGWHQQLLRVGGGTVPVKPDKPKDPAKPEWIRMEAKPAWSKGSGGYVQQFPTHYNVRPEVKKLVEKYLNLPAFKGKVSANTYHLHPPANPHETVSVDFWDWRGRGFPLNDNLQTQLFDVILKDPTPPRIHWTISNGQMWTDGVGWGPSPGGPAGSDAGHFNHIHTTWWPIED